MNPVTRRLVVFSYRGGPRLMSRLRKRWALLRNPHAEIVFQGPVHVGPGFKLVMPYGGRLIVGAGVEFRRGFTAEFAGPESTLVIGERAIFTWDPIIQVTTRIEIGADSGIGQNCFIVDGSHKFDDLEKPPLAQGYNYRPLTIGAGAAIHSKVTIIADVGERAVIAANAAVVKPIPARAVAGGVPAKVIRYLGERDEAADAAPAEPSLGRD